jgi:hypothetical protein
MPSLPVSGLAPWWRMGRLCYPDRSTHHSAMASERYAAETKTVLNRCVRILTKGKEND